MKQYKIWLSVEEHDEELQTYEDVSTLPVSIGPFNTLQEADALIQSMTGKSSMAPAAGWCSSLFQILDDSYATDTAIIEAMNHYMKQRRARRGY